MLNNLIDFHFDFETRSRADLSKVGVVKYATDVSTEATLLTWCFGRTGSVKAWRINQPIPADLAHVISFPEQYNFNAFNSEFDYMIWVMPFAKQVAMQGLMLKRPSLSNISDTMALSNHFRTGGSLEACAKMNGIPMSKDKEGRRLMLKQCKPNSRTGEFHSLSPDEWIAFERYGIIDTMILREAYYKLPQLPSSERWIFEWTFRRNLTGIPLDIELVNVLKRIVDYYLPKISEEFMSITGLKVKSTKCLEWFKPHFPWIKNMQADTIRDMNEENNSNKPAHVQRALHLKTLAGSTSVSKVECAVNMVFNNRIYNTLEYHKAHTKRFAGKGIQIQNFARPSDKGADDLPANLDVVDLASEVLAAAPNLKEPIDYVKNLLRRIWLPEQGEVIYCGDFSKIEPTILYWLTGKGEVPKNAYERMASNIYSVPADKIGKDSEERTVGKSAELGGGYGMGHKKFRDDTYKKTGILLEPDFAKHVINTYRKVNHEIVKLWGDLQQAFRRAINNEGTALCDRRIHVMPMQHPHKGVKIRLPSGSYLYYHGAYCKVEVENIEIVELVSGIPVVKTTQRTSENMYYMTDLGRGIIGSTKIYGGLLTEHVTSATSRDLMAFAMYNLEQVNFKILTTIHDEVWSSSVLGRGEEFNRVMCTLPYWCQDLKVTADLKCGVRYLK